MVHDPTQPVNNMFADVGEFHAKFLLHPFISFASMPPDLVRFREHFLVEEASETYECMAKKDHAGALDGLVDLVYVALGTLYLMGTHRSELMTPTDSVKFLQIVNLSDGITLTFESKQYLIDLVYCCRELAISLGWHFDEAWRLVHAANMTKIRTERPADSKRGSGWDVVKPVSFVAPDLSHLVGA